MAETLLGALDEALEALDTKPVDAAAVQLAREYATRLDGGADASKHGPPYLACLESLGMTPRARAAITGKGAPQSEPGSNPLRAVRDAAAR